MDVTIRCICPPKAGEVRHPEGDRVTLRAALPFQTVAAIRWAIGIQKTTDPRASLADMFGLLTEHYVMGGVESWSVVGGDGKPLDLTPDALRDVLLTQVDAAIVVADAADDLYQAVMLPLILGSSTSSQPSPMTESTSPTPSEPSDSPAVAKSTSSPTHRKRSRRSSISTIPTAVTETTSSSLELDSSSSQSSVTAA